MLTRPRFVLALLLLPTLCGCPPSAPRSAPRHATAEPMPLAPQPSPTRHLVADAAEP